MEATETSVWVFEVEIVSEAAMVTIGFFPDLYHTLAEARAAIIAERSKHPRLIRMVRALKMELQR